MYRQTAGIHVYVGRWGGGGQVGGDWLIVTLTAIII